MFACTREPVLLWYSTDMSNFAVLRSPHLGGLSSHAPLGTAALCEDISRLVSRYPFRPSTHFSVPLALPRRSNAPLLRRPGIFTWTM